MISKKFPKKDTNFLIKNNIKIIFVKLDLIIKNFNKTTKHIKRKSS